MEKLNKELLTNQEYLFIIDIKAGLRQIGFITENIVHFNVANNYIKFEGTTINENNEREYDHYSYRVPDDMFTAVPVDTKYYVDGSDF